MLPIVMHHGLFGFDYLKIGPVRVTNFTGIDRAFSEKGHPVFLTRVHPCAGVERRARELKTAILQNLSVIGREKSQVIIFAHSMGGLDARHMITHLGMADQIAALVTISTPHRGSAYADWCAIHLGKNLRGYRLLNNLGLDIQAALDLTTESCARFNEKTPDMPGVKYYSVSCAREFRKITPTFYHAWRIINEAEGPNDGLVSVTSAMWGEHLATWPADHLHAINKRLVPEFKNKTGDITPYYLNVLQTLKEKEPQMNTDEHR